MLPEGAHLKSVAVGLEDPGAQDHARGGGAEERLAEGLVHLARPAWPVRRPSEQLPRHRAAEEARHELRLQRARHLCNGA